MILAGTDKEALGPIRCLQGLQVAADASGIWLRGIPVGDLPMGIQQLPALHTYWLDGEDRLFPLKRSTPVCKLPDLLWQPLAVFIPVSLPVSGLPGKLAEPYFPRLTATNIVKKAEGLQTSLHLWKQYVVDAPLVRLQPLRFAASRQHQVLVIGEPLPPLPGAVFWMQGNLLIPAGYNFDPPLAGVLASEVLAGEGDGVLLFDKDGSWQRIASDHIIPASRSAVRLIPEGGSHG